MLYSSRPLALLTQSTTLLPWLQPCMAMHEQPKMWVTATCLCHQPMYWLTECSQHIRQTATHTRQPLLSAASTRATRPLTAAIVHTLASGHALSQSIPGFANTLAGTGPGL